MWNWFGQQPQTSRRAPVTLHVYDLGPAVAGVNAILGAVGTGAFHAGVEVYGTEWSFGCCSDGPYGSGIFCVPPKGCEAHVYREAVEMGETTMSKREVDDLIDKLAREWGGASYDLLRHNCCHFSDEFCKRLGVDPVPAWVLSLAGVGAMLRSAVRLGAGAVGGAACAVYEGAAYAVENMPAGRRRSGDDGAPPLAPLQEQGGAPQQQHASPFSCQMPPAGGRRSSLGEGLGGPAGNGGLGAGFRAGLGVGLGKMRAQLFDDAGKGRAASSRASAQKGGEADVAAEGDSTRLAAGDVVEVYSNSHGSWCLGRVESVDGTDMATVTFRLPNAGPNELATKILPLGHKHLRRAKSEAGKGADGAAALAEGDLVEIFSNSKKVWCPGYIESVSGRSVKVAFQLPGFAEGELAHKELPIDHKDVRRRGSDKKGPTPPEADAPSSRQVRRAKTDNNLDEAGPNATQAAGAAAARNYGRRATVQGFEGAAEADPAPAADAASPDGDGYRVGEWVEVFTNTHQVWCLGRVTQADDAGKVHVVFQMPGAGADEWVVKRLAPGCKELRRAAVTSSVELPSPAEPAWTGEEESAYGQRFKALLAIDTAKAEGSLVSDSTLADFLRTSGLPRRALKEIWQVANPTGKAMLGLPEFRICCRLIAHCQTRSWERADILSEGGDTLRRLCETELLQSPAPKLAEFKGQ